MKFIFQVEHIIHSKFKQNVILGHFDLGTHLIQYVRFVLIEKYIRVKNSLSVTGYWCIRIASHQFFELPPTITRVTPDFLKIFFITPY